MAHDVLRDFDLDHHPSLVEGGIEVLGVPNRSYRRGLLRNIMRAIIDVLPPNSSELDLAYLKKLQADLSYFEEFAQIDRIRAHELLLQWYRLVQPLLLTYWRIVANSEHQHCDRSFDMRFARFILDGIAEKLIRLTTLPPQA